MKYIIICCAFLLTGCLETVIQQAQVKQFYTYCEKQGGLVEITEESKNVRRVECFDPDGNIIKMPTYKKKEVLE